MSAVIEISSKREFTAALRKYRRLVVDFWAPWCGPCKQMAPAFAKIAGELGSAKVGFAKINTDLDGGDYGASLTALPTMVFYLDGIEYERSIGAMSEKNLREEITEILAEKSGKA